ncbi:hypothetical protein GCM10010964_09050 [Caldovatus sediminis]|uniref:Uncharacterized protein n=1 Tax=Caldovatus sediminis TaxID=2041189 RepID=A0A8J3EBG5_9PROT|nr:hypothetical protein GCM10010964_09050 [Caldovatus sediminis]
MDGGASRAGRVGLSLALAAAVAVVSGPGEAHRPAAQRAGPEAAPAGPPRIGVRVGDHPTHGRVVFHAPPGLSYRIERLGEHRLAVRFDAPAGVILDLGRARPPRNVAALRALGDGAEITLRAGARPRHFRLGRLVVVDARDPRPPGRQPGARADGDAPAGAPAVAVPSPGTAMFPAREAQGRDADRPDGPEGAAQPNERREALGPAAHAEGPGLAPAVAGEIAGTTPSAETAPGSAGGAAASTPVPATSAPVPGGEPPPLPSGIGVGVAAPPVLGAAAPEAAQPREAGAVASPPSSAASAIGSSDLPAPATPASGPTARAQPASETRVPPHFLPAPPTVGREARPVRIVADPAPSGRALLLPFGPEVGAAAFRRGDAAVVVFDAAQPLDLGTLVGDPVFGAIEARITADATVLRLPLAAPGHLVPRRSADHGQAWLVEMRQEAAPPARPLATEPEAEPPRLAVRASQPGRSIVLADPLTGAPLLVGTLREDGQAMALSRRGAQFDLLPSVLGVVVLARSDALVLRAGLDRFTLSAAGGAELVLGEAWDAPAAAAEAATMGRVLDLPVAPAEALLERLRHLQGAIAAAAPLARAPLRREATEALLALGLAQEAQAMSALAFQEDPRAVDDPRLLLAHGAAALLAGRPAEAASAIEDRRLPEVEETELWRAVLAAARGAPEAAAPVLAGTAPLLLVYPGAVQARLLPSAVEALIGAAGQRPTLLGAARRLLEEAAVETPLLALAQARLAEAEGRTGEALAAYDALARGRDRLARARAIHRAVELRLATGALDPPGAAAALEAALFAWRGDAIEVGARLRLAALKREIGDAEGAFALLREAEAQHPDHAGTLRPRLREALLAAMAQAPPLRAVALADASQDLLPEAGEAGVAALMLLADRLIALDLSDRAARLLGVTAVRSLESPARAALGARLAALRLDEGDFAGALLALGATAAVGLPQSLTAEREVLRARALARGGDPQAAAAALRRLGAAGAEALAELLAEARDWPGAAAALAVHVENALPAPPAPLSPEHRRALARLAAFAALAGDEARLAALRAAHGPRMRNGPLGEAFALLTAAPVRGLDDLPRLQRELEAIRTLTSRLEPLRTGGPVTR